MKKQLVLVFLSLLLCASAFSQKVYFTESNNNRIRVANLTPANINTPVDFITGLSSPSKVEVDQINNRLYYLTAGGGDLIAANISTGATESVVITMGAMAELNDIAFSDSEGGLFCANGIEVEGVHFVPSNNNDSGLDYPVPMGTYNNHYMNSIAVDDDNGLVFMASSASYEIMSAPFGGSANPDILAVLNDPQLIAYDRVNNDVYILSYSASTYHLYRFDMDTGMLSAELANLGSNWINDLQIFPTYNKIYYAVENVGIYSVPLSGGTGTQEISLAGAGMIFFSIYNDVTSPVFTALSPADGSTNVLSNANFVMTFDENVVKSATAGTANETGIRLMRLSDNSQVEILDRSSASVSISNNIATVNFATTMDVSTDYYVLVGNKVFSDNSGNNFVGITLSTGWNVRTNAGVTLNRPTAVACVGTYKSYPAITITESSPTDFQPGTSVTMFFTFSSAGYLFENTTGSITATTGGDIAINSFSIGPSQIRITYTITGTSAIDAITISGTKINSSVETNPSTTLIRSSGTGIVEGLAVNTVIANINTQAQPPAPGVVFNQGSQVCLNEDPSAFTVTTDGTFVRWFTANNLFPASFITALNDRNTVSMTELGLDTSTPGVLSRFVRQNVGGCISLATQLDFTVNDPPQNITLGKTDQTACSPPNGSVSVTDINGGGVAGYTFEWFDASLNSLGVTAATMSNLSAGTYHVQVTNATTGCSANASIDVLNAVTAPVAVPPSGDVCESAAGSGSANVNLTTYNSGITAGNADLSVTWEDAMNNPVTNVVVSDNSTYNYEVTSASTGCVTTGSLLFTVHPAPSVSAAGPDQLVCGVSATLGATLPTSGTGTWTVFIGTGGLLLSPSDPNSTFDGIAGSTYILRWTVSTAAPCTPSVDEVSINFESLPSVSNAGSDQTVCGTSTTLAANTPTSGTGGWSVITGSGGSFSAPTSPTSGFTGIAGTTYNLRWTITGCVVTTDDVTINFTAPPSTANAGPDQTVCGTSATLAGNSPVSVTGAWTIISGAGGTIATPSSQSSTFSGNAGSTYILRWTVSSPGCTPSSDDVSITFNAPPTISNAGIDQTVCGTSATLAANTPASGTGGWSVVSGSGGSFSASASPTSGFTGTSGVSYVLRWTITNCSTSSDEVNITFTAPPSTANAGPDQTVCGTSATLAGNPPVSGTGTWTIIAGAGGTVATASSPTSTFTGNAGATYTLRWTLSSPGCAASSDDVNIIFNSAPAAANAGTDKSFCGNTVAMTANTPTSGTGAWSVVSGAGGTFSNASSASTNFTGVAGATYTLRWTITNPPCAPSADDVTVTLVAPPTVANAGADQVVCNTTATLSANTPTIGTGTWSVVTGAGGTITNPASPGSTFTGNANVTYTLRWTTINGICNPSSDDVTISLNTPPTAAQAGADQNICGTSVALSANTPASGTGAWSIVSGSGGTVNAPASPTSNFTGVAGNTYTLRWTVSKNGCASSTDEVSVTFRSSPGGSGIISPATALCEGTSAILTVTGFTNATTFQWSTPAGITAGPGNGSSLEITAESGGGGTVTVTPQNDCGSGATASVAISVLPRPSLEIILPPAAFPEEVVAFSFNSDQSIQSSEWSFGDGATAAEASPQHAYGNAGDFEVFVEAITTNGCPGSASATYTVLSEPELSDYAIKNVITANGDDKNRILYIENLDRFPENEVRFLDRWGVEIFSASNYQNDWEARGRDGQFLPAGQYICIVKLNSTGKVISRTVSILKGR